MRQFLIRNVSMRKRLILYFAVLAILPLLFNVFLSFRNDRSQILENRDQLAGMDAQQITRDLDMELAGYEAVLYQLYTDDEFSQLATKLDRQLESAITRSQLRRMMQGVFWLKDYIASITVVTQSGETATYHRLSATSQTNVSLKALGLKPEELYNLLSERKGTTYFPVRYVTRFNGENYDLFYIGHRVLSEQIGRTDAVILMGVDAELLEKTLSKNWLGSQRQKYMFILDDGGDIVWYPDREMIGKNVYEEGGSLRGFIAATNRMDSRELAAYTRESAQTGWHVVSVLDCTTFTHAIDERLIVTILITLLSFGVVIVLVFALTERLTRSVEDVCQTMQKVSNGDLTVRAEYPAHMTTEIRVIAVGLNSMADRLQELIRDREESVEKIKNAEIAALEAQLNPHFLYNTLDTLNWMAIEEGQYPISNVISALGKTLRYGIDYSNSIVTMEDELEWLKQYLFIHQNRLKGNFHCQMDIPKEVLSCRVHKLFLQPFIENAMIHGFTQEQTDCVLKIRMRLIEGRLVVEISDNGCGIPTQVLDKLNTCRSSIDRSKRYHGMQNAINRLILYYGQAARISVSSSEAAGTRISISIPADIAEEGGVTACGS